MAYEDVDIIAQVLTSILSKVSTDLQTAGRPVARIFRSAGAPPWDCSQLSAWPTHQVIPSKDKSGTRRIMQHSVLVSVQLIRCLTVVESGIPTEAEMDADGAGFAIDQWIIAKSLATWPETRGCSIVRFDGISPELQSTFSGMTARLLVGVT